MGLLPLCAFYHSSGFVHLWPPQLGLLHLLQSMICNRMTQDLNLELADVINKIYQAGQELRPHRDERWSHETRRNVSQNNELKNLV